MLGQSWILTPEGVVDSEEARRRASSLKAPAVGGPPGLRGRLPVAIRVAYKDVRQAVRAHRFRKSGIAGPWQSSDLAFVWQRHDLFYTTGMFAADALKCPLVLFVDAPVIWEHRRWGIPRPPGWGKVIEAAGENRLFRKAALVACVSDEVSEEIGRRGIPEDRIVVTPNGVDLNLFGNNDGSRVRRDYDLVDSQVVGWIGTFRPFHGIELAVEAVRAVQEKIPNVALLLVGEGSERQAIEELCRTRGIRNAVFTGAVPHHLMGAYLSAMDVGLVLAGDSSHFHYSPLKLREYMACSVPVIAPRVGEMSRMLQDGTDALLVDPDDSSMLANAIHQVLTDPHLSKQLSITGRHRMAKEGSWTRPVERVLDSLARIER